MGKSKWSTVVLPPTQTPRFRPRCHFCGVERGVAPRRLRVARVGDRGARSAYVIAPNHVLVPACAPCQWRQRAAFATSAVLVAAAVVLVLAAIAEGVVLPRGATAPPPSLGLLAAVGGLMLFAWFGRRVDIAFDGKMVRYSFRHAEVAAWFAADNAAAIETVPPRQSG